MFCLTVIDHVRLNFGQVAHNYSVHARAAERLAGWARRTRLTVLALLIMCAGAAIAAIIKPTDAFEISAAIAAGLALASYVTYLALGVEGRVHAHRHCAQQLWNVSEQYRALLAELQDGLVEQPALLRRRDALIAAMNAVYEQPFPVDQPAFESVRLLGGDTIGSDDIDRMLPGSLRRRTAPDAA